MEVRTSARILIVEDNADLAFGLQKTLEANGYHVEVAGDGTRALERVRTIRPQLVILDLMMPVVDGFTVLHNIRREGIDVPVLILSAKSEEADKLRGFRAGADDFVTKPFGLLELVARVAALLRRTTSQGHAATPSSSPTEQGATTVRFHDVHIDPVARRVVRGGIPVPMTPKEMDLLLALTAMPGTAVSRRRLLADVWGHAPDVQTRTVDIHIAELRRKLEPEPAHPRHFITVWKTGYRFDP
ncbi:MAG: response regulator transcription factor [Gemmatimonadaceae bacterium]|nr:response regulator transcription factor [Gemmatimonadaceae bacterium]